MEEWAGILRQAFVAGSLLNFHQRHVKPLACCEIERCRVGRGALSAFISGERAAIRVAAFAIHGPTVYCELSGGIAGSRTVSEFVRW